MYDSSSDDYYPSYSNKYYGKYHDDSSSDDYYHNIYDHFPPPIKTTPIFDIKNTQYKEICATPNLQHKQCLHLPITFMTFELPEFIKFSLILDPLAQILVFSPHTMRKLMGTCKTLYTYFANYTIPCFKQKEFLIDALDNNCKYCITELSKSYPQNSELIKYALNNGLSSIKFLRSTSLHMNDIMECAKNIIKYPNGSELVEYLLANYAIYDNVLILIAHLLNYKSMQSYIKKNTINKTTIKILLPLLCHHHLDDCIRNNIYYFTNDEYTYFMEVLIKDVQLWPSNLIVKFLEQYIDNLMYAADADIKEFIINYAINADIKEFIINYAINNVNKTLIDTILKKFQLNLEYIQQIIKLTQENETFNKGYYSTEERIDNHIDKSLELTKHFNDECIKNNLEKIYVKQLTVEEIVLIIINTNANKKLMSKCISGIIDKINHDNKQFVTNYVIQLMIDYALHNNEGLLEDIILKIDLNELHIMQLIPFIYKHIRYHPDKLTNTIKNSRELSLLCNEEALKNKKTQLYSTKVYTQEISIQEILQSVFKTDNITLKQNFIDGLKNKSNNFTIFCNNNHKIPEKIYIIKKKFTEYDDYEDYEDNEIYEAYRIKIKITNKVSKLNYAKELVELDDSLYHKIIDFIIFKTNGYHFNKHTYHDVITFLANHEKFNEVCPCKILKILSIYSYYEKIYSNHDKIIEIILNNHSFFKQFQ